MENSQTLNVASDIVNSATLQDVTVSGSTNAAVTAANESIFGYFWNAGLLIKFVMLILLIASVWSWTIIISKHFRLKKLKADADDFEDTFWSGTPLDSIYRELKDAVFDPMSNIFCAAMAEWNRFSNKNDARHSDMLTTGTLERRVDRAMQIAIRKEIDELEKNMGFLSSLGTNGVIVGLFGTVIGILNGFKVIALQQSSSLATVAPVISEALFTTALGFIAALPAAVAYNKLMTEVNRYVNRMETFADEFSSIVARQFDER